MQQLQKSRIMSTNHRRCQELLVVCLVLMVLMVSTAVKGSVSINLLPNDPEGLVGQDMHLWCSLTNESQELEDPYFSIVFSNRKTHHQLPANDSVLLNRTTIMLTISNLTDSYDEALLFCWNGRDSVFQVIKVGRQPVKPNIVYYRYLNWENFVFGWKIKPKYNGFKTKYTAWFKSSTDADFTPCDVLKCEPSRMSNCIRQNEQNCTVPAAFLSRARLDGFIYFKVNGTNKAGNVTSETFVKQLEPIAQPGPVKNLKFKVVNNSDQITYFRPEESHLLYIKFRLVSKVNPNEIYEWTNVNMAQWRKRQQSENLTSLKPYTQYHLAIRIKYYASKFQSKWTEIEFTSHEEAPSQAPEVCRSCFESEGRTLILHFKPLTKEQSRGLVSYAVRFVSLSATDMHSRHLAIGSNQSSDTVANLTTDVSTSAGELRLNYSKGEALFRLPIVSSSMAYQLEVFAKTLSGRSLSTYIRIPAKAEMPLAPTNCTVMTVNDDSDEVIFRWNNTYSSQRLSTYTVVWCMGSMNRMLCEDPIEWKEVNGNESSVFVTLKGGYSGYMFGISANTEDGQSSGIQWSCSFYDRNSVASPPYIYPLRIEETVIEVQLGMPHYSPKEGLVYGYNVYYYGIEDEYERNSVKIYLEERATRGIVKIEGLSRGKSYKFMAESLTLAGPSDFRTSRILATKPFNFSTAEITGLIVVLVVLCILAVVGFICCLRYPLKFRRWITGFKPCMPDVVLEDNCNKEQSSNPDYCAVVETFSIHDHFDQQNTEEGDGASCSSEPTSPYSCVSRADPVMTFSRRLSDSSSSSLANILPPLRTSSAKLNQKRRKIDIRSFPECFDDSSKTESDSTISCTVNSDSEEPVLPAEAPPSAFNHAEIPVSLLVKDPGEEDRLLPTVTGLQGLKPSLLNTTQDAIEPFSLDVYDLDVYSLDLKSTSIFLPSVHLNQRTKASDEENVLPKIHANSVTRTDSSLVLRRLETPAVTITRQEGVTDNSLETGDQEGSSAAGTCDVTYKSSHLRMSCHSSDSEETSPYSDSSTEGNISPPFSNADDEGIYL